MRSSARSCRTLALAAALAAAAAVTPAAAQNFHQMNAQLLHGTSFDDARLGNNPVDGDMTTLTLEGVSTWRYGDSFFFIDFTFGDFGPGPAGEHRIYAEWAPRLSLGKLAGLKVGGPVQDVLIAGGIDHTTGFHANLIGLGVDLKLPGFAVFQLNGYRRDDNFNSPTYQVTPVWVAPFRTGPLAWSFTGFADFVGTEDDGLDLVTQPQLLLDLGSLAGGSAGQLQAGVEWYLHDVADETTSVPQVMVKYIW